MRTQVGIVGAGPAGLLLSHLLHLHGIESIVVEARSRQYVEDRVRAGVLEQGSVDLLNECGLGERMRREGLIHEGIQLLFGGQSHRIHFKDLIGRCVTVYGQQEVVKDLIQARLNAAGTIIFDAPGIALRNLQSDRPSLCYGTQELECDFIAGCDGFHGICRPAIPASALQSYERVYPFAWLGILAQAAPAADELIYAHHQRGFALLSMRSQTVTRLYLQCPPEENLTNWTDERLWNELRLRLGPEHVIQGPILQKGVTPMRSFVTEPMRYGRLFLAGDAAHIVPPTGAKGMNLAISDVRILAEALHAFYTTGTQTHLDSYSLRCLQKVWRAQHFSWWMTMLLHRFDGANAGFDHRRQLAELEHITTCRGAAISLAENYTNACGS